MFIGREIANTAPLGCRGETGDRAAPSLLEEADLRTRPGVEQTPTTWRSFDETSNFS